MDDEKRSTPPADETAAANTADNQTITISQGELDEIKKQRDEYLDGWKRAQADYQNLLKETAKERQETAGYVLIDLLKEFLPAHNHLKLALKQTPAENKKSDWLVGIEQIKKELDAMLAKWGVKEIKTNGAPFDPAKHEAIGKRQAENQTPGTIIEEAAAGYQLADQTIIPAKVIVAEELEI